MIYQNDAYDLWDSQYEQKSYFSDLRPPYSLNL